MRQIANSQSFKLPPTIEDATVLDQIKSRLQAAGFAKPASH